MLPVVLVPACKWVAGFKQPVSPASPTLGPWGWYLVQATHDTDLPSTTSWAWAQLARPLLSARPVWN